ncbi:MAG: hypothetical protein HZB81_07945 [Deltaproteobacteria bacterium]|nr:hypothetical protein [Deltaproteobacteria bacterium]
MSFWFYKKDRKSLFAVDIPLELLVMLVAIVAAFFIPTFSKMRASLKPAQTTQNISLPISFIISGFILFLIAKISLFAKGIWNSWGASQMSGTFRVFYVMGYIFVDIHLVPETAFMVNKIVETTSMGGGK